MRPCSVRDVRTEPAITGYHTIELPSGPTNGEYDLRGAVGALMAVRRVCRGQLVVSGVVSLGKSARRGPLYFQATIAGRLDDPLQRTLAELRKQASQLMLRRGVPHVGMLARPRP